MTDKLTVQNAKTVTSLQEEIQDIKIQQQLAMNHLDNLEQYGRRENLEIHGIPEMNHESTNEIVKSVAKALNVDLDENQISTSHCIAQPKRDRQQQRKSNQSPPIIVRFSNRDKRNEIFRKKKMLRSNPSVNSTFGNVYVNITENLTKRRKTLFNTAKLAKRDLHFGFLWTSQGRIRLRRDSESEIINVSLLSDLYKLGYSGPEAFN